MKYALLLNADESIHIPHAEEERIVAQHVTVSQALLEAGQFVRAARLSLSADAKTVRRRGEDAVVLDGPFAETKEQVGGFYVIEAASREEAIDWAKRILAGHRGSIEIRPASAGATRHENVPLASQYMLMFVTSRDALARQAPQDRLRARDLHYEVSLELAAQGKFLLARALDDPAEAVTLRPSADGFTVTQGPCAEAKEFITGFSIIGSDSPEEAVGWAQRLLGSLEAVEVRPLWPN